MIYKPYLLSELLKYLVYLGIGIWRISYWLMGRGIFQIIIVGLCLFLGVLCSQDKGLVGKDPIYGYVNNFVGQDFYRLNERFINRIFQNPENFYQDGKINYRKILEALKNNGLLNLKFSSPREVNVVFSSSTSALFLLKTVNEVLSSMGYSYFEVKRAEYQNGISSIVFDFMSEYMLDPLIVIDEMNKRGYVFDDVQRIDSWAWQYDVTLIDSKLANATTIHGGDSLDLKDVAGEYWLMFGNDFGSLSVKANAPDWYPKIIFFNKDLQILDILKKQDSSQSITFHISRDVRFVLISDSKSSTALKGGIHIVFDPYEETHEGKKDSQDLDNGELSKEKQP